VGFALETETDEKLVSAARTKLAKKRVDLVVANHPDSSIAKEQISGSLVGVRDAEAFGPLPKHEAADRILDFVAARLRGLDAQQ
jgi:phosphopantothenoylcysteine decarboxylase/phosphopantothenate--cysteine ligase